MDPIFYQDKGVFFTNFVELTRAHQNAANRVVALEQKVANTQTGEGSDFADLEKKVNDLGGSLETLRTELKNVDAKLDGLFPDETQQPQPEQPEPPKETEPEPEPSEPEAPTEPTEPTEPAPVETEEPAPTEPKAEEPAS